MAAQAKEAKEVEQGQKQRNARKHLCLFAGFRGTFEATVGGIWGYFIIFYAIFLLYYIIVCAAIHPTNS